MIAGNHIKVPFSSKLFIVGSNTQTQTTKGSYCLQVLTKFHSISWECPPHSPLLTWVYNYVPYTIVFVSFYTHHPRCWIVLHITIYVIYVRFFFMAFAPNLLRFFFVRICIQQREKGRESNIWSPKSHSILVWLFLCVVNSLKPRVLRCERARPSIKVTCFLTLTFIHLRVKAHFSAN